MRMKFAIPVLIVLSVVAVTFHVGGFVSPGWTVIELNGISYKAGLWYIIRCSTTSCRTMSIMDPDVDFYIRYTVSNGIVGPQTEVTVALVLTIVATITVLFFRKFPQHHVSLIFVIVILMACHFIAGVVALVACGTKGRQLIEVDELYNLGIPYSIIMTGFASLTNLASGVLLILYLINFVNVLKKQSGSTPLYLKSQMQQPLTKEDSREQKKPRIKKSKAAENKYRDGEKHDEFEKEITADRYDEHGFKKEKGDKGFSQHAYEMEVTDDEVDQPDYRGKHRSKYQTQTHNTPAISDQVGYQDKTVANNGYSHKDSPRKLRSKSPRNGHTHSETPTQMDYQDKTVDNNEYPQYDDRPHYDDRPRKSKSKSPRHGHTNPQTPSHIDYQHDTHVNDYNTNTDYPPRTKSKSKTRRRDDTDRTTSTQGVEVVGSVSSNPRVFDDQYQVETVTNDTVHYGPQAISRSQDPHLDFNTAATTQLDYKDSNGGDTDYTHSNKPIPRPRKSKRVRNKPKVIKQDRYDDSFVAPGYGRHDDEQVPTSPRAPSYYEKLELEAQSRAFYGRARQSPVESSV